MFTEAESKNFIDIIRDVGFDSETVRSKVQYYVF